MTRTSWKSALALALALGGSAAWSQEPNAIDEFQGSSNTPMTPNCTRVPYFNELPQLLFSHNLPAKVYTGSNKRAAACAFGEVLGCNHQTPVLSVDRETASDQATQRMLAKLLALWKTYYKEGRYQEAANVAQKALGLAPGNLAAEIALALARKHCWVDSVQNEVHANCPNAIKTCAGQCPGNESNPSGCGSCTAAAASSDCKAAGTPCCPPCPQGASMGISRGFVPGMTPVCPFMTGMHVGPNAIMPPPFAGPPWAMPGCMPPVVFVPVPMHFVPPYMQVPIQETSAVAMPRPATSVVRTTAAVPSTETPKADIRVTATGKRIHIVSPCLEAHCDHMTALNLNGRVLLEGTVNLKVHMEGHSAQIVGNRIIVGLTDGTFEIEPGPALVPTGVFSEPVLRGVRPAAVWRAIPPAAPEKPKCKAESASPDAYPCTPTFQSWSSYIR